MTVCDSTNMYLCYNISCIFLCRHIRLLLSEYENKIWFSVWNRSNESNCMHRPFEQKIFSAHFKNIYVSSDVSLRQKYMNVRTINKLSIKKKMYEKQGEKIENGAMKRLDCTAIRHLWRCQCICKSFWWKCMAQNNTKYDWHAYSHCTNMLSLLWKWKWKTIECIWCVRRLKMKNILTVHDEHNTFADGRWYSIRCNAQIWAHI